MGLFVGTKLINAEPMSRGEYCLHRGWKVPTDEDPNDSGFLVEHLSKTNGTTIEYSGYISWMPTEEFFEHYRSSENMNFGEALEFMKAGAKISRKGWNGKDMFLFIVPGSTFKVNRPPLLGIYPEDTEINYRPHIDMKTVNGEIVPWVASQSDLFESDWILVK